MAALPLWLHQAILRVFTVLSVSANSLLIILIAHPTSKNLGQYRVLLCTFAVVDVIISVFHVNILPVYIVTTYANTTQFVEVFVQAEFGFVIFAFNTLYLPDKLGYALNQFYCILFYEPFILLTFHFFYRLMSVFRADAVHAHFGKGLLVAILLNAGIAVMICAAVWLIYPEIHEHYFGEVLNKEYGIDMEIEPNLIPVHYIHAPEYGGGLNWNSILSMLSMGSMINVMIIFNITCGKLIMRAVKDRAMSDAFRNLQVQLLRALVVQFTVPLVFCVLPFFLIVGLPATGIGFGQTGNIMGFVVSAFPVIDPICVILAYSRFRALITNFLRVLAKREETIMVQSKIEPSLVARG